MATLVTNCPRCGVSRMTFDVNATPVYIGKRYGWSTIYEIGAVCRHCLKPTIFRIGAEKTEIPNGANVFTGDWVVTTYYEVTGFVSIRDLHAQQPPEHVPEDVGRAFQEAATCMAVECWNAAGAMFRASIDLATKEKLPKEEVENGPSKKERDKLYWRLRWLFNNGVLPKDLESLSECVREDGNDGVHGALLEKGDAEDLLDFTVALLERIYTEPKRVEIAKERRDKRREPKAEA